MVRVIARGLMGISIGASDCFEGRMVHGTALKERLVQVNGAKE